MTAHARFALSWPFANFSGRFYQATLASNRAAAAVDEALAPVGKPEARIAPFETVARTKSALKS